MQSIKILKNAGEKKILNKKAKPESENKADSGFLFHKYGAGHCIELRTVQNPGKCCMIKTVLLQKTTQSETAERERSS